MGKKNVFLIGLDDFNRDKLESIAQADRYEFHGILDPAELFETYDFPVADMMARAEAHLFDWQKSGQSIDGLTGYLDFPVSTMLPLLCSKFGLPCPSLASLLQCEHKYWSRLSQKEIIPEHIPQFYPFDPFDDQAFEGIPLEPPFWVKPIKSTGSLLGFRIKNKHDFQSAMAKIRSQIHLLAEPFNHILDQADLPDKVRAISGYYCLAESIISGRQCTVEGYSFQGEVVTFGIIDSIRYENGVSFFRYEYPSTLPDLVQNRIKEISQKIITYIGLDSSTFNIEFYWNREQDKIWLLEINPRISQSHSDSFQKVDGQSNQQITVQIACGEKPDFQKGQGLFNCAAKFFWRLFEGDAIVTRVPSQKEIQRAEQSIPGTIIIPQIKKGMRLSELLEQDSYSYAICHIFLGGSNQKDLLDKYVHCKEMLPFEFRACD